MIYGVDISTIIFEKHWQIILETSSVAIANFVECWQIGRIFWTLLALVCYCFFCLHFSTSPSKPSISEWRRLKPKWRWISLMISAVRGSWDKSELLIPGHKLLLICWYVDGCRTWVFEGSIGICSWLYLLSVLFPLVQHDLGEHLGDTWNDAVFRSKWGVSAQMRWTGEYLGSVSMRFSWSSQENLLTQLQEIFEISFPHGSPPNGGSKKACMLILGRFLERTSVGSKSLNLALLRPKLPPEIFTPQVWVRYIYIFLWAGTPRCGSMETAWVYWVIAKLGSSSISNCTGRSWNTNLWIKWINSC